MRNREAIADDLLSKVGTVQSQLDSMRSYQEELLEYADIAKRVETNPRKQLILSLAAENKQIEQLKVQNKTLEASLEEHQITLEMIMSKYREHIASLMQTNETEKKANQRSQQEKASHRRGKSDGESPTPPPPPPAGQQERALVDERLAVMAAIAQEVSEQSESYSNELEMELHRLRAENQTLRELLAINTNTQLREGSSSPRPGPRGHVASNFLNNSNNSSGCGSSDESSTFDVEESVTTYPFRVSGHAGGSTAAS
ncbi:unnamed protein product [Mesocestoides corti]|uniref:FGFR1 oncogene partner 2 n=1 Tax=Mesocestoides corti TaxID=53468 RepID=A0A0R3UI53_MESCO|nr:unnamed protein product [Mesocestoides corti]